MIQQAQILSQQFDLAQRAVHQASQSSTLLTPNELLVGSYYLPKFIRDYASYADSRVGAPMLYHITTPISLLSAITQRYAQVPFVHATKGIFGNCWMLWLGRSRFFHKTASQNVGVDLLVAAKFDEFYAEENTPEALVEVMVNKPQGILLRDEFSGLLANMSRSYQQGFKELMAKLYDCPEKYERNLRSKKFKAEKLCFSLFSATTPNQFISNLVPNDWENGFLARFLFVFPDEPAPYRDATFVTSQHIQVRNNLVNYLIDFRKAVRKNPRPVCITDEALSRYNQYCKELEAEVEADPDGVQLSSNYGELETYAAKIAMLMELSNSHLQQTLRDQTSVLISKSTMLSALTMTEIFKQQVRRLLMAYNHQISKEDCNKVEQLVLKNPGITYSDLLWRSHLKAHKFKPVLEELENKGIINELDKKYYHA